MEYVFIFILSILIVLLYLNFINKDSNNQEASEKKNIVSTSDKHNKKRFNLNVPSTDILSNTDYKKYLLNFKKDDSKMLVPFAINEKNDIESIDLNEMENILILGTTGGGKSVLLNELITSIIMNYTKDEVKFVTIDSSIVELSAYNNIPHYIKNTITDMKSATGELELVLREIERRKKSSEIKEHLIVIVDDLYDLAYNQEKYIHGLISELLEKSPSTKVHLVLATDTPEEKNLPRNLVKRFKTKFYLTLAPGTYKEFNIDKDLTDDEIDYMMTIGNAIYLADNEKRRVKILEVPEKNIKEVIDYYSI